MTEINKNIYNDGTYLHNNTNWHREDSKWKAKEVEKIIKKNNLNIQDFSEIGCGAGEILNSLSSRFEGAKFVGYEVSEDAYNLSKQINNKKINFFLKDILEENIYHELLLCLDVFEHVSDYMGFLKKIKNKSKYKIFHIPLDMNVLSLLNNSIITARKEVGHLHYFNSNTALATLNDTGYKIIDFKFTKKFELQRKVKLRTYITNFLRKLLFKISPSFSVKLIGGCSLMVLAE